MASRAIPACSDWIRRPNDLMGKLRQLPDYVKPGVRLLLVGINPGLRSAAVGHHFAGHSNRFWKLLAESKLVPVPLSYREDHRLPEFGIGLTNIIGKPSRGIDSLTTAEYRAGRKRLLAKVKRFKPRMVALLGITIYRVLFHDEAGRPLRRIRQGLSTQTLGGVPIFVLPQSQRAQCSRLLCGYAAGLSTPPGTGDTQPEIS
jgi:TDG/mug DNA glycosylase family protein